MSEELWTWYPDGDYDQCCCACGRLVPANRPRKVLKREFSPVDKAVIKHPACRGVILYNRKGVRIEKIAIPEPGSMQLVDA